MRNSRGYILLDTLAALSMIIFVCLSLLPILEKIDQDRKDLQRYLKANHILYENLQKYTLSLNVVTALDDPLFKCQFTTTFQPLETNSHYVKGCVTYKNSQQKKLSFVMLLRKEKGFTLIEMLLSLLTFIIMATLILQIMLNIQPMKSSSKELNKMEWEIFLHNVKREIRNSSRTEVKNNKLYLTYDDHVSSIEKYGFTLRRRVNDMGHETMLYNVKNFSALKEEQFIILTVTDPSDQQFSETVFTINE